MFDMRKQACTVVLVLGCIATHTAHAHFTLKAPASWLNEGSDGAPQKGGPCGPGGYDNVNPVPASGKITEFHVGETIDVQWTDTVAHPGYFRIALAPNRDDLKNPTIVQDGSCNFDETMVPTSASGNVLADGVSFRSRVGFSDAAGKMFTQKVTLPNTPCDKCTLQVVQVMENDLQALSKCYYFHCADIKILPAGVPGSAGTSGGVAGDGASGVGAGGAGSGTAGAGEQTGGGAGIAAPGNGGSAGGGVAGASGGVVGGGVGGSLASGGSGGGGSTSSSKSGCAVAQRSGSSSGDAWLAAGLITAACLFVRRRTSRSPR